ncbi:MAG: Dbl homology domain-containing protein [Olpidium bornovanus]|uniref:Dbl homology domain-containing protein n=1 Tax=Olpidium bornovanus TaxID=278681 RepID=A0A8H8DGN9_9FUNG|nr:MAG: Dbl homology domain-containing protein [Olpidium bornovanus]
MELYATEMSYVSDLDTAIRVFLKPLRALFETPTSKKGGVGREQIAAIFSNVEEIAERHHGFVEALGKLVESWGENERLGSLFMDMSRWLYVYVPYCNNYEISHNTLGEPPAYPSWAFLFPAGPPPPPLASRCCE